ncbi:MAG: hypothetical protein RLY35_1096 [Bacteroidota bacterium]|jgi:hypothetical protein
MRNLFFQLGMLAMLVLGISAASENPSGKAGKTGSPGEGDCTDCHSTYALNAGTGSVVITSSNLTNWEYVPGNTYSITVTVTHTGRSAFGLGFEALRSNGANAGTLTAGTGTHTLSATVGGNSRTNIVQSTSGGTGTTGSHTFNFTWTAPATNVGAVTFYCTGLAANSSNGNSSDASDYVYSTSQVVQPFIAQIQGCTDQSACNYNPSANVNVGCIYPQQYYNCAGNCLVDVDNDGICDQLEVLGCTNPSACNFNPSAGLNDNSCYFPLQSCDDSNINTVGDTWTNSCSCEGLDTTFHCSSFNVSSSMSQLICYNESNANITLSSSNSNLQYFWNNGSTAASLVNLSSGNYYVTITDGACSENMGFTIFDLLPIEVSSLISNVSCNGGNDGEIVIQPFGGVSPYTLTGDPLLGLTAGDYSYTITDALGCAIPYTATVDEPAAMNVAIGGLSGVVANSSHFYSASSMSGASYVWAADGATITSGQGTSSCVFQFGNDSLVTLTLNVTNSSGCSVTDTLIVNVSGTLGIVESTVQRNFIFPNPAHSEIFISSLTNDKQIVEIFNASGERIYKNSMMGQTKISVSEWPSGVYLVRWLENGKLIRSDNFLRE